ncbi:MAG: hypothetical protein ACRD0P_03120 [Stackebrandtia sp.]
MTEHHPEVTDDETDEAGRGLSETQMRRLFIGGGIGVAVIGVIVVLVLTLTSGLPGDEPSSPNGPDESRPPLAQECPPPTSIPSDPPAPSEPEGDRTVDSDTGISYRAYGDPWHSWDQGGFTQGDLKVEYLTGQYFVTETYPKGEYMATILSGNVEAAVNDGTQLDLECVGPKVAADVRSNYYPNPNEMESISEESATLGGRPAWIKEFRLTFDEPGLKADSELVAVALIDVGRAEAAVLYVSIPDTHDKYDKIVDELFESVRPAD